MVHIEQRQKTREIKLTCTDLAIKLGVSERTIYRYFDGKHNSFDTIRKVAIKECIEQAIKRREWEIQKRKLKQRYE